MLSVACYGILAHRAVPFGSGGRIRYQVSLFWPVKSCLARFVTLLLFRGSVAGRLLPSGVCLVPHLRDANQEHHKNL